jgi:ring-1,2-phenylacetyl-CoA epoxidase subunit PaaC
MKAESRGESLQATLTSLLLAMGDDEFILGHRDSEWCGSAPILEEDIAFANIALDELGHAKIWYTLLGSLIGENPDTYPDHLVFERAAGDFRNLQLVELPNGDWAFSMLRQYLFDAFEIARLESLKDSAYLPLAEAASKIRKEETYHYRHTQAWVLRLGQGTDESQRRMQNALNELWPYTRQMFFPHPGDAELVEAGYTFPMERIQKAWEGRVLPLLASCGLRLPDFDDMQVRREQHTKHLKVLLDEMQSVARLDPRAEW